MHPVSSLLIKPDEFVSWMGPAVQWPTGRVKEGRSCRIITDPPQHRDLPADEQTGLQMAELAGQSVGEWKLISWSLMPVY